MSISRTKTLTLPKRFLLFFAIFLLMVFLIDKVIMPYYVQQGKTTKVPNVTGLTLDEAMKVLVDQGLEGRKADVRPDKQYAEGTVAQQNPAPGAEVKFGRGVYLTLSGGEMRVEVPDLKGRTIRDATFALERYALRIGEIRYEVSSDFPVNTVIQQGTTEGTKVSRSTAVDVVLSQGPNKEQIPVPNVVQRTFSDAQRILLQLNLRVGNVTYQPNKDLLPNTVMDQFPKPGEMVAEGHAVDLIVVGTRRRTGQEN